MGGTGRFKGAKKGVLTYTETAVPVLADASDNPVFFTETGEITERFPESARSKAKTKGNRCKRYRSLRS